MPANIILSILVVFAIATSTSAQDPARFKDQVKKIKKQQNNFKKGEKVFLFTGSSSIRAWNDIENYFPDKNIINTGFGGSHMSDLLHYYRKLVLKHSY